MTPEQVDRWGIGYAVDGRLSGRIVMPWRDARGALKGYTARTFIPGHRRYIEPGRDERADLAAVYGEEHWPPPGDARQVVVVVEGGFDGLAVERATGLPFGAFRGSCLLPGHLARIATFREVVVAADPDKAGKRLAESLHSSLARWVPIRFADLPPGTDPARIYHDAGPAVLAEALGCPVAQ